jgi:hypothetical protein
MWMREREKEVFWMRRDRKRARAREWERGS